MTSGNFHHVEIEKIVVDRDQRQRRELEGLDELSDSIKRLGLINPIVVTRPGLQLVAGERRLESCRLLGWTHIPCHFADELSEFELKSIELEENIKRRQLPWQDECRAVYLFHELHKAENPGWTQDDTAAAVGLTAPRIRERLDIAREMLSGNQRVVEAPRMSVAAGIVQRKKERLNNAAMDELKEIEAIPRDKPLVQDFPDSILNIDFLKWAETYEGPRFNFIHCDFPYGIGANKFNQGSASLHGGYDDDESVYWELIHCLVRNIDNICTDSCHIMFWFSLHYYQSTLDFFQRNSDFHIDPFPLVWVKSDNIGTLPDPQRGPRRIYETAFFGSRGDRKIVRAKSNAYSCPTVRDVHMSVKPEPMLRNFFEMFVDESTIFLDPTCGSGSSVRAAESLGAPHVLGLELNPEFHESASRALRSARLMRKAKVNGG